jgi:hypothetical protein
MTTPAIERTSWEEKLRTLEKLRDSITREGDRYGLQVDLLVTTRKRTAERVVANA